jgi:predicted CXXCH cytochrome family protein
MIKGAFLALLAVLIPASLGAFDQSASPAFSLAQSSQYCRACHDGVIARVVDRSHSMDIDYRGAQLRSRGKLRDVFQLDPAVSLRDGVVVCTSCHRPDSLLRAKLVVSNEGSKLCFSCHNL